MSSGNVTLCGCDPTAITTPIVGKLTLYVHNQWTKPKKKRFEARIEINCEGIKYLQRDTPPVLLAISPGLNVLTHITR